MTLDIQMFPKGQLPIFVNISLINWHKNKLFVDLHRFR
jgi:hypothetical protein